MTPSSYLTYWTAMGVWRCENRATWCPTLSSPPHAPPLSQGSRLQAEEILVSSCP